MIVVGIDPHKRSHTAVALERQTGELVGELSVPATPEGCTRLAAWALALGEEVVFALEDCRHVSGPLERFLLAHALQVVRVPPKLMARTRRSARRRGKSDAIDATAVARAYLREPGLPRASVHPQARELKLLVDHREDLVQERTRFCNRLRWHLHELAVGAELPSGALDRACWQKRIEERLALLEQTTQVEIARELLARIGELTRRSKELEGEIAARVAASAPAVLALTGCAALTSAKIVAETGGVERFRDDCRARPARWGCPPRCLLRRTASPSPEPHRQPPAELRIAPNGGHPRGGSTPVPGHTSSVGRPRGRRAGRRFAVSSGIWPASSTTHSKTARRRGRLDASRP